jgi:hypothetical protein
VAILVEQTGLFAANFTEPQELHGVASTLLRGELWNRNLPISTAPKVHL